MTHVISCIYLASGIDDFVKVDEADPPVEYNALQAEEHSA